MVLDMKNTDKNKCAKKSSIGGQALIEGVMMRGVDKVSMAVRTIDGSIDVETFPVKSNSDRPFILRLPIIRGVINFVSSMILGYKTLMKSAEKSGFEESEQKELKINVFNLFKIDLMIIIGIIGSVLGLAVALVLFKVFPPYIVKWFSNVFKDVPYAGKFFSYRLTKTVIEGVLKIIILIVYLGLTSLMKDIKRVYMYHGAEHKTIACYEAGEELTVENVRKYSRYHPRCGTSFILIMLVLGIVIFFFIPWDNIFIRIIIQLMLMPLIVGIGYEILKLTGKYNNLLTRILTAPGKAFQRITTREPDDSQIEVAIQSLIPVLPTEGQDDTWGA
jgi:uncharacterized protein YqhQ